MRCPRLSCGLPATWRVVVLFLSGRRIDEQLCTHHADALFEGLRDKPQTSSAWKTPLVAEVAA